MDSKSLNRDDILHDPAHNQRNFFSQGHLTEQVFNLCRNNMRGHYRTPSFILVNRFTPLEKVSTQNTFSHFPYYHEYSAHGTSLAHRCFLRPQRKWTT